MAKSFIKVNSLTSGSRGKEILERNGYRASLRKSDREFLAEGCSYMLVFDGDLQKALQLLEVPGIRITGSGKM